MSSQTDSSEVAMTEMICPRCMFCGVQTVLTVPFEGYQMRRQGAAVQVAFPDMSRQIREIVISGTHPECWDAEFGNWEGDQ